MDDPYAVLGVPRTATDDEIEQAYRARAMRLHPDHAARNDPAAVAEATAAFVALGAARDALRRRRSRDDAGAEAAPSVDEDHPGQGVCDPPSASRLRWPIVRERVEVVCGIEVTPDWGLGRSPFDPTTLRRSTLGLSLSVRRGERIPAGVLSHPELFEVVAPGAPIHRADLDAVARNPVIRRVHLSDAELDDLGLARLCAGGTICDLELDGTLITDAACATAASLPTLTELSVQETSITDAGLRRLALSGSLRSIDLRGTRVTAQGVRMLDGLDLVRLSLPKGIGWFSRRAIERAHPGLILT